MEIVFLGTGTSQGVPLLVNNDPGLDLSHPRNWRTRSSIHVKLGGKSIQIDAAPEFRLQCLREKITWIDFFILTHGHSDHILGMDDLRVFCGLLGGKLPVYASEEDGLPRIHAVFPYAINPDIVYKGYPLFDCKPMPSVIEWAGGRVFSTRLPHGRIQTIGLVFEDTITGQRVAYYSDCHVIPDEAMHLASNVDILIIDGLRHKPHPTHMTIKEAIAVSQAIKAKTTYLTHLGAVIDYETESRVLPEGVFLAYDGLRV